MDPSIEDMRLSKEALVMPETVDPAEDVDAEREGTLVFGGAGACGSPVDFWTGANGAIVVRIDGTESFEAISIKLASCVCVGAWMFVKTSSAK